MPGPAKISLKWPIILRFGHRLVRRMLVCTLESTRFIERSFLMSSRNDVMGKEANADAGDFKERASAMASKLRETGGAIRDEAKESFDKGRETVRHWEESLEREIQERPLRSILIAVGVGWLIGAVWRRL
jgi:ElaB/YqjD/DUF883 family membrane-anchored ribosome-binding protein